MDTTTESITCPHCGMAYGYDHKRHCWQCDGAACPHCLPGNHPLCPECRFGDLPAHLEPMLATTGAMPRDENGWSFEYKWDGIRALCYWQAGEMRLESRTLREITAIYPDLKPDGAEMPKTDAIFDGEILALDSQGKPSFKRLQHRMHASPRRAAQLARKEPVRYFVFDLLWSNGESLVELPYQARREQLEALGITQARWQIPAAHVGEGQRMLRVARAWGLEGLMAKRLDSTYRTGERSRDWIKIKLVKRQEFVVGGWEPREGNPRQIGALLVGFYTPDHTGLQYAGRVGTGFNARTHESLIAALDQQKQAHNPFTGAAGKRGTRWVMPALVVETAYRRWPPGGSLQQASYQGIRNDIPAWDVVHEMEE